MRYTNPQVLSAANTATATGAKIDANQLLQASFQPVFGDSTAVGVVKIQMSNDPCPSGSYDSTAFVPTNWSDIPSATSAITAGVGAPILLTTMAYRWIRVVYTRTSGGSTTVVVNMFAMSI